MRRAKIVLIVAVATTAVLAGMSAPVAASPRGERFSETIEFTETGVDNSCTPEFDDITLDITDRVQGFKWEEDGRFFFDVHVSGHAEGIAADGTVYEGKLNGKISGSNDAEGIDEHFQIVHRLISHGATPNLIVQEWGHFTYPPPAVTFERGRMGCTG